ncbi:MAG: hypothetical protein ACXIUP_11120 [Microcella sp.]
MEWIVFSPNVASLTAQLAAILVVAFMVELRALGSRRAVKGKDARSLLGYAFGSFGIVVIASLFLLNDGGVLKGGSALLAWIVIIMPLSLLAFCVGIAGWASIQISEQDVGKRKQREQLVDARLREPGWKWLLLKAKRDSSQE